MKTLRSTTALALCAALSIPHPALAAEHMSLPVCGDAPEPPCLLENGLALIPDEGQDAGQCPAELSADATPCLTPEGFVAVTEEAAATAAQEAADAIEEAPAEEEATTEEAPAEDMPAEVVEETPAEDVPSDEAAAEATEAAPAEEAMTEEAPADEATAPADEATAEALEEAPAEETPAEETPADEATAEAPEEAPAEEVMTAEEEMTAEEAPVEEAPAEEAAAEAPEEAPAEQSTSEAVAEAPVEEVIVEEAPAAAAAAAMEDDETASEEAEVATEEVTEENSRSSSEDFETTATGEANATATAQSDGDSGMSNFEKALLLGLGAVAVGSILQNGDEVVSNSGDRVVLRDEEGDLRVLKDDDALLRQPGSQVRTETFNDGSTRTIVTRDDGIRVITIRAADGRVVRRVREFPDGERVVLFDDTEVSEPVVVSELPRPAKRSLGVDATDEDALRRALAEVRAERLDRSFSLRQVRQIREVRELAPEIELDSVTFATGSAAIEPSQAEELAGLGRAMQRMIDERPGEVFLIEGHTDAVGSATYNLALSDRRAETVALALAEYFGVPPENMITQGYGESALKIETEAAERLNRRAAVRRITPLLRQAVLDN
ncbi:MAG: OmpA family protein [Silicimonas sp.]